MVSAKIVIICILFDVTLGDGKRYTTTVVLVTQQVVIGSAVDIDKLPKADFRSRSRVVLGTNCSGPSILVREYSYHPAYNNTTYSALVLVQLDTDYLMQKLHPICSPPAVWKNPEVYAVTLSDDCKRSQIRMFKMIYVRGENCKSYYNNIGLDVTSMWPTHTVCARALRGKECVWRNGAILMLRQDNIWSLMGFGVAGPGCRAPARFIDYGMNIRWVMNSIDRIGRPAVTRISRNQLVMRRILLLSLGTGAPKYQPHPFDFVQKRVVRIVNDPRLTDRLEPLSLRRDIGSVCVFYRLYYALSNLQRFGPCDPEEIKAELFTDLTSVTAAPKVELRRIRYNFTIISNMEYSCIIFKVDGQWKPHHLPPLIRLRRWCSSPSPICYFSKHLQIDFYVEIFFSGDMTYTVAAYGEEPRMVDMKKLMAYTNQKRSFPKTNI